jgi:rhodanese-related sulfurtransferase
MVESKAMTDIQRLTPAEASAKIADGFTYVDVRTPQEFEAGHPAGAFNVPIALNGPAGMAPNDDFIRVMLASFGKEGRVVVGCKAGVRSMKAAQALVAAGFTNVLEQKAGWDGQRSPFGQVLEKGWSQAGLPVETGSPAGRTWDELRAK